MQVLKFIIHARKALLKKLSPKENLNIPILNMISFINLKIILKMMKLLLMEASKQLLKLKIIYKELMVMIGRAIYHSPYFLVEIEKEVFGNKNVPTRSEVMENLIYIQEKLPRELN